MDRRDNWTGVRQSTAYAARHKKQETMNKNKNIKYVTTKYNGE